MSNYFLNQEILARIADGNVMAWKAEEAEEKSYETGTCIICGEIKSLIELQPDFACIACIMKNE